MSWWKAALAGCVLVSATDGWAKRDPVDFNQETMRHVGRLYIERGGEKMRCTATLVGYDIILTAAHCLQKSDKIFDGRVTPEGATFQLQYSNNEFVAESKLISAYCPKEYEALAVSIAGGDWAVARLEKPLGKKFGYTELAPAILPLEHKVKAIGYSSGGQEEHPGVDSDCKIVPYDTETAKKFRALGVPTVNYFMTTCDINSGASGGPMIADIDFFPAGGGKEKVTRIFAINAATEKANKNPNTIATGVLPVFHDWGLLVAHAHFDELHDLYGGRIPAKLPAAWKGTLDNWGRWTRKERDAEIRRNMSDPKTIPTTLILARTYRNEAVKEWKEDYALGFQVEGNYAPLKIKSVDASSTAEKAGLKVGDLVKKAEGTEYPNDYEFRKGVNASGGFILMKVLRGKKEIEVSMRLDKK